VAATIDQSPSSEGEPSSDRARARARKRGELTFADRIVRALLGFAAVLPAAALVFLAYELIKKAWPSITANGFGFFTGKVFQLPQGGYSSIQGKYGVLVMLFGTLVCSAIALAVALPISVGGAILLVERVPRSLQNTLGIFLELLAGIPSVVFGLWGYLIFGPFMSRTVFRWIADLHIPWLKGPITNLNQGLLTASLVLAAMIIPIIASTTRELVRSVPELTKEGAVALGLTGSETARAVTFPFVRTGILAAALLGWARALGETIAVLLISGVALNGFPHSIFDTFATMASTIADLLDTALTTPSALSALCEVALVLLAITLITNFVGRFITSRLAGPGLPVGRGV
jgi:phosphate transport system permease protein